MSHQRRFPLSVVLVVMMVAAACTSSSDSGADAVGTDESTEATSSLAPSTTTVDTTVPDATSSLPPLTASFRGVSETTIDVGVVGIDFDSLRDLGLVDINRGDEELVWQTLVDHFNSQGGVLGRELELHFRIFDVIQPASAEAVCLELTQDIGVFVQLNGFAGPTQSVDDCFANQNETFLISSEASNEQMVAGEAPWIQAAFPGASRLDRATMDLALAEGLFDGEVVAVHALANAAGDRVDPAADYLRENGVNVAVTSTNDAPSGDAAAGQANWAVISEQYRSAGVTTVFVPGTVTFAYGQIIDNGLHTEVQVITSDNALPQLGSFDDHLPADYAGAIGPMGLTAEDVFEIPAFQECVAAFESATGNEVLNTDDVQPGEPDWIVPVRDACNRIRLFAEIATAAGPDLTNESVRAVIDGGVALDVPQVPFLSFGPDKHDGNDGLRLGRFDPDKGAEGGLVPISDLMPIS